MRAVLALSGFCSSWLMACLPWPEIIPLEPAPEPEPEPCEPRMLVYPRPGHFTRGDSSLLPGDVQCGSITPWAWGIYEARAWQSEATDPSRHEINITARKMDPTMTVPVRKPYAVLVGKRPPSCFVGDGFDGTKASPEIESNYDIFHGTISKDPDGEAFTHVAAPIWPDEAAFDAAPDNDVRYAFVLTDGDPGDEPEEQLRWWQPYPLVIRKACLETEPAVRALIPLGAACSECTALAVDRVGHVTVGGAWGATEGGDRFLSIARLDPESFDPEVPLDKGAPPPWVSRSDAPVSNPKLEQVGVGFDASVFFGGAGTGDIWFDGNKTNTLGYNGFMGRLQMLSGGVAWVRYVEGTPGSSHEERVLSLAVSADGDVFVAGSFADDVSLGAGCQLPGNTGAGKFVAKLSGEGHCQWIRPLSGTMETMRLSAIGKDGVLLAFGFKGTVSLDETALTEFDQEGLAWVVLEGADGIPATSQSSGVRIGTLLSDPAGTLQIRRALAHDGGILLAGSFAGSVFEDGALLDTGTDRGGFVASFAAGGNLSWFLPVGETSNDVIAGISVDATGDVLVGGSVHGEGPLKVEGVSLTRRGAGDILVAKWRPKPEGGNPTLVWAGLWGEEGEDTVSDLTVDGTGHVWVLGDTTGKVRTADNDVEQEPFLLQLYP